MHCRTFDLGGATVIACTRERVRKCFTCSAPNASLSCDGCDHVLCTACAVSPREGLDWCPTCFKPAFEYWKGLVVIPLDRAERRQAFRLWARANPFVFLVHAKERSKRSLKEAGPLDVDTPASVDPAGDDVPTPHELWQQSRGDSARYRELLIEHGHLVRR